MRQVLFHLLLVASQAGDGPTLVGMPGGVGLPFMGADEELQAALAASLQDQCVVVLWSCCTGRFFGVAYTCHVSVQ